MITCQITSNDRFTFQDFTLFDQDGPTLELITILFNLRGYGSNVLKVGADDMVRDDRLKLVEEEDRELRQELALVWNTLSKISSDHC